MNYLKMSPLCSLFFFLCIKGAITDIDATKTTAIEILQRKNPGAIAEFQLFYQKYYQLVSSFLDDNNHQSLANHIAHMEKEMVLLRRIIDDSKFGCIRPLLTEFNEHLSAFIVLLKQYVCSHHTISLALKLRRFEFLLPRTIRQRSFISLFKSLKHRLHCRN